MWLQSCLLPSFSRFSLRRARIVMMRSAMPLTSPSHCLFNDASLRISEAMRAPCTGGLEYRGRTRILIWESTRFFSSADSQTTEKAPTRSPYSPCIRCQSHGTFRCFLSYHVLCETLGQDRAQTLLDE